MEFELPNNEETNIKKHNTVSGDTKMPVTKIDDLKSFQDIISNEDRILVKFEADWCAPCKVMSSVVEEVAKQHPNVNVLAVDIEGEGIDEVLVKYGVRSLPTFVSLKSGAKVASACGTISKEELSSLVSE